MASVGLHCSILPSVSSPRFVVETPPRPRPRPPLNQLHLLTLTPFGTSFDFLLYIAPQQARVEDRSASLPLIEATTRSLSAIRRPQQSDSGLSDRVPLRVGPQPPRATRSSTPSTPSKRPPTSNKAPRRRAPARAMATAAAPAPRLQELASLPNPLCHQRGWEGRSHLCRASRGQSRSR